jgi:CubicO group peptidase (beta-lactamase class C family)
LDDDVGKKCAELASPDVLSGSDKNDQPILQKTASPVLFRHLLTHTSGLAYHFINSEMARWSEVSGKNVDDYQDDILQSYTTPLVAHPGTEWNYSPGLDWAGYHRCSSYQ